ncbi:peptide-methionine (R)-S-oxide reductase [Pseudoalteromonas sp. NBT06-2]|uniref:peptide-methionine (R)-S-oxide reductase MsrB n=1 Tax=Pseudoalteromonas sp. NBT06-2 TaxID=2025950 RepID=UPI000BA52F55|nr:peptide-methionine (R)-S-oxide reductase MsrB [Pseudoalteromonas sp. NBT06-2]PAJ73962.1 peptide-methionine (R)-S-oxide reductase [Pseudoalteromonas sp. NBT06-2]
MKTCWTKHLTQEQKAVCEHGGTEYPHTGEYNNHFEKGVYACICCKLPLFDGDSKFKTGCGWPAFVKPFDNAVKYLVDETHGMKRTEVRCNKCDSHLGHVFDDGPTEEGTRYCINSICLSFDNYN